MLTVNDLYHLTVPIENESDETDNYKVRIELILGAGTTSKRGFFEVTNSRWDHLNQYLVLESEVNIIA
jgi:hypothetical protein